MYRQVRVRPAVQAGTGVPRSTGRCRCALQYRQVQVCSAVQAGTCVVNAIGVWSIIHTMRCV